MNRFFSMVTRMKFIIYFLLASMSLINTVYADPTRLATLLNEIHNMRAAFTQTTYDNRNKAIQQSYGNMALQRPGKFRWQVTKPIPQIIIANQNRLWIYDPDLEQVTIRSLDRTAGEAPALLLSHTNLSLEKEFTIQEEKNSQNLTWFNLTPKNKDSAFASIKLGFLQNQIKEMQLKDHLGHTTRIQFQKIEMNISLASSLFIFRAPKNVDVINEAR